MRHGFCATILAVGLVTVASAGDQAAFSRAEGTYASSALKGWSLKLDRHGNAVFTLADLELSDRAVTREGRIGIHLPLPVPPGQPAANPPQGTSIPSPRVRSDRGSWPPSLEDPTAVVVMPQQQNDEPVERVWLTPIEWGPRLYLVRDVSGFCKSIALGAEPRVVAEGTELLRAGDHLKRVPREAPAQCRKQP
jgi:hypothetical protein